jgi:ABC-type transport system involved in multi-copper enzyme maturation permease subunit
MSAFLRTVRDRLGGDRAAVTVLVVLAGLGLALSFRFLTLAQQAVLWGLLILAVAVAARQGRLKLFGPVLFYDLVRSARRLRFVVIRTLYALLVAFVLCWMFWIFVIEQGWRMPAERMSTFATGFFYTFLMIQFFTVVLLTPAYVAGAVAEEKERKTLEFILATDLRNREIVLGKLVSRLLNLTLLLLAGVPILSFLQFLGGIDLKLVLAGFSATALTMFSLAGLSMLNSVLCRRARDAIVLTYLMAVAYYLVASGSLIIFPLTTSGTIPGLATFPSFGNFKSPVELGDLVVWLNAGNVGYAVFRLGRGASASAVFDQELPAVLGGYAAFHALAGMACLGWSVLRLRVLALRERVRSSPRTKAGRGRVRRLRRVGRHPMIWKEVYAEGGLQLNSLGRIVAGVLLLASFLPIIIIVWVYVDNGFHARGWDEVSEAINAAQMRFVGTVVACLLLLAVVVRAAGSVRSEHERHTFDELLTTRLTNSEILFGKWLGAVMSVRWGWAWLGLIWFISLVTGGVLIVALPMIFVAWVVYAAVGAGIGLWFSVGSKSTLRATVAALATMIFLSGGHWLVSALFCYMPMAAFGLHERQFEWLLFMEAGQSPPFVMGLFAYHGHEFRNPYGAQEMVKFTIASLFGVGCWAALVPVLWLLVKRRFERVTGRTAVLLPERVTPRRPRRLPPPKKARAIDAAPAGNGQEITADIPTVLPVDDKEVGGSGRPPS